MQHQENKQPETDTNAATATAAETTTQTATADAAPQTKNVAAEEMIDLAAKNAQIIADLEAKIADLQDAFMRAKADGENIRRRAQDDITKAHKFAIEGFAEAMVPVKDSLEMALKQLSAAFEKNRLLEINPVQGEKLDPMKHQAISMVPAEQDANTVVTVLQKGYNIADRLLRPALVTVAQGK